MTRHIQSPVIGYYSAVFRHIQILVQCLHMLKPGILAILEYAEPFPITASWGIFRTLSNLQKFSKIFINLTYLKPNTYSESSQRFKMKFFGKRVKHYNYFFQSIHLRTLTGFWIRLSLKQILFNVEGDSALLYHTYS